MMSARARQRREVLARRAQYLRDKDIPTAKTKGAEDHARAELGALRFALRLIDADHDLANALAHYPADQAIFEEDRMVS